MATEEAERANSNANNVFWFIQLSCGLRPEILSEMGQNNRTTLF
jgi:hypothetical protein